MWDIDGQMLSIETCSLTYLRSLGTLNVKFVCGERTLWMKGYPEHAPANIKEHLTCLACLVSP